MYKLRVPLNVQFCTCQKEKDVSWRLVEVNLHDSDHRSILETNKIFIFIIFKLMTVIICGFQLKKLCEITLTKKNELRL